MKNILDKNYFSSNFAHLRKGMSVFMKKPIIGIVGRENLSQAEEKAIFSTDDRYRRAVIKARWNSYFNITNSRL